MPETESLKTSTPTTSVTHTVYVNVDFATLATEIKAAKVGDADGLIKRFNGKGRSMAFISGAIEENNVKYFEDPDEKNTYPQPFLMNEGDKIAFILQEKSTAGNKKIKSKWTGILQNQNDLQLVEDTISTYKAIVSDKSHTEEKDQVIINTNFRIKHKDGTKEKFAVSWDPQVKIRR